jgi:predicted outer membrane repeat protein
MRIVPALRLIFAVFVAFLAAMCFQAPAMAGTFNVSDAAGLRGALITAAANGQDDVIVLAAGTYATGGTPFTASNESKTLTIQGANGTTRSQVVLDGGGTSRVLDFGCAGTCGAITLLGVTVQNGNATGAGGDGGGVKASPLLVISDVMFLGNRAFGSGGAIYTIGVGAAVSNSTFSSNSAQWGGAIWGSGTVTNSTFSGNTASQSGGAIYGLGTVTNSTFSNNTAFGTGGGGAIEGGGGILTVTNSTFSNNMASNGRGGAIDGYRTAVVTNSTFSSNSAQSGGAIWFGDICCALGTLIVVNNTFSGNAAGVSGAAVYVYSTSSIINSVFYGHSKPAIFAQSAYNLYSNLIDTSTGIAGSTPIMVGNVAPGATSPFVNVANGNFRLAPGSLAIDTGLDPNSTTFASLMLGTPPAPIRQTLLKDLDGNPRPTPGTAVDMGSYEFVPPNVFTSRSDCLFNWAERVYPNLFAPAGAISNTLAPYYYRHYSQTNAYLGTSSADNHGAIVKSGVCKVDQAATLLPC